MSTAFNAIVAKSYCMQDKKTLKEFYANRSPNKFFPFKDSNLLINYIERMSIKRLLQMHFKSLSFSSKFLFASDFSTDR